MDPKNWRELTKTGVSEIDNEHRLILHMVEELRSAFRSATRDTLPGPLVASTFHNLMIFINEHFGAEEKLMQDSGYPEYDLHKGEHDRFLEYLGQTTDASLLADAPAMLEFLNTLSNWLHHHVLEVDRRLSYFLLERLVVDRVPKFNRDAPPPSAAP